jgi:hypothetical protein
MLPGNLLVDYKLLSLKQIDRNFFLLFFERKILAEVVALLKGMGVWQGESMDSLKYR